MRKKLLSLLASFTLCASMFAITNMCIKLNDGTVLKYNIDDVEEVYYEGEEPQEIMACVKQKDGSVVKYSIANTEQVYYEDEEETPETIPNAGDFCFTFNVTSDSTVEVKDGTKCQDSAIVIPPKVILDGKVYVVTAIGDDAFWGYELVKSVTLPNTIKEIGSYAFCCESLEHINIPEGVTSIGAHAFGAPKGGISNLTDIEIPSSVTYIGTGAFYQCYKLKPELLVYNNGTRCYGMLGDRDVNTEIVIPDGVTDIDDYAFNYENKLITKVTVPSSVTNIGREAFYGCLNLDLYIDNYEENVKTDAYSINFCKSVTWMKGKEPVAELEYEYVDLGLPSGLKWATTNYGATKPEEPGASIRAYEISAPSFVNKWRTPTMKEIEELIENCTWTWIELNGVVGYKVESKEAGNSNWIFLASHISGDDFLTYSYWSSSMTTSACNRCLRIYDIKYSNSISKSSESREGMCKVRFVSE